MRCISCGVRECAGCFLNLYLPRGQIPLLVRMPVLYGKPDLPAMSPLEPSVQGRKYITAQAGDAPLQP